jgi:hypothetical protein
LIATKNEKYKTRLQKRRVSFCVIELPKVQECDATGGDKNIKAGNIKIK